MISPYIDTESLSSSNLTQNDLAWLSFASAFNVPSKAWLNALTTLNVPLIELVSELKQLPKGDELVSRISYTRVNDALQWLDVTQQRHIITFDSPLYPDALKQLSNPPLALFVKGDPTLLNRPQIAIVGSRRATHYGTALAAEFARCLSAKGLTITSGLATGIDSAAHKGGIVEQGKTVAVTGTGPDVCYPARNKALANDIVYKKGAIVTEFFPSVGPKAWHFPRRNRIIAALSLGTLVVEAKIKSGTLITANLAADLGKEVFAVPGNVSHAYSEGCHWLIQQGAKLVTNINDILDEITFEPLGRDENTFIDNQKSEVNNLATDKLLASVDYDITAIDVIAQRNAITVQKAMALLLEYELRGFVAAVPGGYVKLRGK